MQRKICTINGFGVADKKAFIGILRHTPFEIKDLIILNSMTNVENFCFLGSSSPLVVFCTRRTNLYMVFDMG